MSINQHLEILRFYPCSEINHLVFYPLLKVPHAQPCHFNHSDCHKLINTYSIVLKTRCFIFCLVRYNIPETLFENIIIGMVIFYSFSFPSFNLYLRPRMIICYE